MGSEINANEFLEQCVGKRVSLETVEGTLRKGVLSSLVTTKMLHGGGRFSTSPLELILDGDGADPIPYARLISVQRLED